MQKMNELMNMTGADEKHNIELFDGFSYPKW